MRNDVFETELQYYPADVTISKPKGVTTLNVLLDTIRNPPKKYKNIFKGIREASLEGDVKRKDELKKQLVYFTPCITTNGTGRSYDNLVDFSGLVIFEFDKIDFAKELKQYIFDNFKCVIAAFISPSGNGCKFIAKIPECNSVEEYKHYYCGLSYYLQFIEGYDLANYNPLLPLFLSWDPDILIRDDFETWAIRGKKINSFDEKVKVEVKDKNINTPENERIIRNRICDRISKIYDNGHPQVLTTATLLGGYVGYGYISQFTAESMINEYIEQNSYLSKGVKGYQRTARQMIVKGSKAPLSLFKD